jgi:succinate-semialdehyde dehydrogenase / glutarate-semialdehyde dehydrogenase
VTSYPNICMFVGDWTKGERGETLPVLNPASGEVIGEVPKASKDDLDRAIAAAKAGFAIWRKASALERGLVLRKAADILASRIEAIAVILTQEHGKPLAEARAEILASVDLIGWFSEECRRSYGYVIPPRAADVHQYVVREPVGIVAGFTPWNFPIAQAVRKVAAAIAAGCSMVLKGPEETPASCAAMMQVFIDAGLPPGVLNLVFGIPAEISEYLIPHPAIQKVSFTGSTAVGKRLAGLAGAHMKRMTMELGGHAPAIVFQDADVDRAAEILPFNKFRNAGQICTSPSRFLVHESQFDRFVEQFSAHARRVKVGDGLAKDTQMGPLAHARRVEAMEALVNDAVEKGAKIITGGRRIGNKGYYFEPTVLTEVPRDARIMNEEPFGPVAPINSFRSYDEAISEANRLSYGLGAFAYTGSLKTASAVAADIASGMVSINHHGIALTETPLGGIKDSGSGWEGGREGIREYQNLKFISQATG